MSTVRRPAPDMETWALYGRVSSPTQKKKETIESQLAELQQAAADRGARRVLVYKDDGVSSELLEREGLDRLRDDARRGLFGHLLVLHPWRLARDYIWRRIVTDELAKLGIEVIFLSRENDDSPQGQLLEAIEGAVGNYEKAQIKDRTRRGRLHRVNNGHAWRSDYNRPYGWRYVIEPGERYGKLVPVPEEIAVVEQIFAYILSGKTAYWVAEELNRLGLRTTRGNPWRAWSVTGVVRNPLHTGLGTTNRYYAKEPQERKVKYPDRRNTSKAERPRAEWKTVQTGLVIIPPERQAAALEALSRNRKLSKRNGKQTYLLSGLVRCGHARLDDAERACGQVMTGVVYGRAGEKGTRYYQCNRRYYEDHAKRCPHRVNADRLEAAVWDSLVRLFRDPAMTLEHLTVSREELAEGRVRAEREVYAAERAAAEATAMLDRLLDLHLRGKLDEATYERRQAALVEERAGHEVRIAEARRCLATASEDGETWAGIAAFCAGLAEELDELERPEEVEARKAVVQQVVRRVTVTAGRVEVAGWLGAIDTVTPQRSPP